MPGSSLWLLPPPTHPLHTRLNSLITSLLPTYLPQESSSSPDVVPHYFAAHVTLTSNIPPSLYGSDPQGWLERAFAIKATELAKEVYPRVRFEKVDTQDVFFRRCFIRVGFEGVRNLAGLARAVGVHDEGDSVERNGEGGVKFGGETEKWLGEWREAFGPHVSLMYGDVPISEENLEQVARVVREAGVKLAGNQGRTDGDREGEGLDGWEGGVVWLVPTDRPIAEWRPIATWTIPS